MIGLRPRKEGGDAHTEKSKLRRPEGGGGHVGESWADTEVSGKLYTHTAQQFSALRYETSFVFLLVSLKQQQKQLVTSKFEVVLV